MSRRNTAPMEARVVLTLHGSAQPSKSSSPSKSKASSVRRIVPTLPGSCTPSSTTYRRPVSFSGRALWGRRQVNSAPWGVFMGDTEAITSRGICTIRAHLGRVSRAMSSLRATSTISAPQRTASPRSLGLSQRKSPVSRRYAASFPSFFMCCISGFVRAVILSISPSFRRLPNR